MDGFPTKVSFFGQIGFKKHPYIHMCTHIPEKEKNNTNKKIKNKKVKNENTRTGTRTRTSKAHPRYLGSALRPNF